VCSRCLHDPEPLDAEFFCVACKTPFLNPHPLDEDGRCALCRLGVTGFDAVYSFGSYEGTLRTLVHLFKYGKIHTLAKPLGEMLGNAIPREERFDVVVPMPLHWRRRWQRGFNQSELLAKVIARRWGVPVVGAVRRVKATAPQAGLTNAKRRKNMSGAFTPSRRLFRNKLLERVLGGRFVFGSRKKLSGARVLLVDDVMTTGATAAACARALKRAGAKHVTLAAVARTDRRVALTDFEMAEAAVSRDVTEPAARDIKSRKTAGGTTT